MERQSVAIYPASYYVAPVERMGQAIEAIEEELEGRYREFEQQGKLLEAQRIKMRTTFDLEMIRELGFCSGIETTPGKLTSANRGSRQLVYWTTSRKTSSPLSTSHT